MVMASELRRGMALRIENQVFRVLEVEARGGAAKTSGTVRTTLENLRSGRQWEQHFRPQERLEDVELQKRALQFLYSNGQTCTFLKLDTYEQVDIPAERLGLAERLLAAGTELPAEFYEGEPVNIVLPGTVEARVVRTAPATRAQQDSSRKEAILDNGLTIQVPLFVGPGEMVSIDAKTGRYVERAHVVHKRGA